MLCQVFQNLGLDLQISANKKGQSTGRAEMLKNHRGFAVHKLLKLSGLSHTIGLRLLDWTLESAETLKNGEKLLGRVPDLDVWILVLWDF